ncbi:MAG: DUF1284 domain-containing protein [Methanobrevibacter sp.]|nr:DUF1284 domain-containing protein [Methanobrevibacter sp.]
MKENNIISLRGHHLLCLQGYQGYGYDEKFKAKIETIINQLNTNDYKVTLTDSADDLCKSCPNLKDGKCVGELQSSNKSSENQEKINKNNSKIIKIDNIILKKAKLEKNQEYSFNKAISIVNKSFHNIKDVEKVCKDCKWIEECLWIHARKK